MVAAGNPWMTTKELEENYLFKNKRAKKTKGNSCCLEKKDQSYADGAARGCTC
jgi:hypothetical protein